MEDILYLDFIPHLGLPVPPLYGSHNFPALLKVFTNTTAMEGVRPQLHVMPND